MAQLAPSIRLRPGGIIPIAEKSGGRPLVDWVLEGHDRRIHRTLTDVDPDRLVASGCANARGPAFARSFLGSPRVTRIPRSPARRPPPASPPRRGEPDTLVRAGSRA